ncbi:MAG: hypothetical protein ABJP02_18705 [Parasphingorhabdus sp.]|uniref:hypothetical protein n=1 Tax=Parasphingorhabdus sp. TaxID=2709688 RepID=UPI003297753F
MKYISTAIVTGLLLSSSTAMAQNFGSLPSYTDTLLNNASNNDSEIFSGSNSLIRGRKDQKLYVAAVHSLQEKKFDEAAAQFDSLLSKPSRIASPSPSKMTYYLAGASHYFAGNDHAALPFLQTAVRRGSGLNDQQRQFARQLIADINAN